MPQNSDRVLEYLTAHPEGQDDDQIGAALNIDRVQVNMLCRRLAGTGKIVRGKSPNGGKITSRILSNVDLTAAPPISAEPSTTPALKINFAEPLVWLTDSAAMRQFTYAGNINLTEDQVKTALKEALEAHGWHVEVHFGHIQGIDIEALRGDERFVLEAKGEGSQSAARAVNFDSALGELLRRMNSASARYGLALPAHRQFVGLVSRLPLWIRQRLSLWFFFVRPNERGLEVGVFPPDANYSSL